MAGVKKEPPVENYFKNLNNSPGQWIITLISVSHCGHTESFKIKYTQYEHMTRHKYDLHTTNDELHKLSSYSAISVILKYLSQLRSYLLSHSYFTEVTLFENSEVL
jgi:hypothetical protein